MLGVGSHADCCVQAVPEGETPSSITMTVFDNLVDFVLPGDRVVVTGIFKAAGVRTKSTSRVMKSVFKTYLDAIHVSKVERNKIMTSELVSGGTNEYQSAFEVPSTSTLYNSTTIRISLQTCTSHCHPVQFSTTSEIISHPFPPHCISSYHPPQHYTRHVALCVTGHLSLPHP